MFKFPTTKEIIKSTKDTFKRFPLAIFFMIVLTFYSIFLVHSNGDLNERLYIIIHVLILGSIWAIGLTIFNEVKEKSSIFKYVSNIILVLVLVGYFFLFNDLESDKVLYRILIITAVSIFAVLFMPYLSKNKQLDYWDFNKEIFMRLSLTVVYSVVIYAGIAIALSIVNLLFDSGINERVYFDLWIIVVGIFAFLMFLGGFPKEYFLKSTNDYNYPKSLKIFVQFILLPLTTIYMVILYFYIGKILINWELPQGSVSYLVLIFSALGMFALMLIYPVQNDNNQKWIRTFGKGMYWAILPLIILLFVAIFIRVGEYGITENRFYVVVLAFWLAGVTIYQLITKQKNIKMITISFSIVFFLASFGPWSAFNVAKISQFNRLDKMLVENGIIVDGKIVQNIELNDSIYNEIYNSTSHIISNNGTQLFEKNYNFKFNKDDEYYSGWNLAYQFIDSLHLIVNYDYISENNEYFYYNFVPEIIKISDYDFYYHNEQYYNSDSTSITIEDNVILKLYSKGNDFIISLNNEEKVFDLDSFQNILSKKYTNSYGEIINEEDATQYFTFKNFEMKMIVEYLEGDTYSDTINYNWFKTTFLIKDLNK
ncbi:MAG: DUF4153 domain-containing protein [Bacteroidales bacterium]|nr:DUF4153 domain-containing protein [Bacteroidales bacterium]